MKNEMKIFLVKNDLLKNSLTSDSSAQLHVLWGYCNPLGMDATEICILKETHQVGFSCFLEGQKGRSTPSPFSILNLLCNLSTESGKGKLP
jgi:hypothetical protein